MEFDAISKDKLYDTVAAAIEEKILVGELMPGDRLPGETTLAQMFGVSRNVVRESLRTLKEWGIVEVRTGSGAYVRKPGVSSLRKSIHRMVVMDDMDYVEFHELRLLLEPKAGSLAAEHITREELSMLKASVESLKTTVDPSDWADEEQRFHGIISKASGNKLLYLFIMSLSDAMRRYLESRDHMLHRNITIKEHMRVYEALSKGDGKEAADALYAHIVSSKNWIKDNMQRKPKQ